MGVLIPQLLLYGSLPLLAAEKLELIFSQVSFVIWQVKIEIYLS